MSKTSKLPGREAVQCDRCAMEFRIASPGDDDSVWIMCPDCGVRFWHYGAAASAGVAIQDLEESRAAWEAARPR